MVQINECIPGLIGDILWFESVTADAVDCVVFESGEFDTVLHESSCDFITRDDRSHAGRCTYLLKKMSYVVTEFRIESIDR